MQRELLMMKAFQHPILGRVLGRVAGPEPILRTGMGFWPARVLHLAVEAGLFTELAAGPRSRDELMTTFGWRPRATEPFLGALVAMGLLRRTRAGRYANTRRAALYLDRTRPTYIGGLIELSSTRLYELWGGLERLLQTGLPEADEERDGNEFFSSLYRDPTALRTFLSGMTGISTAEATLIAARFPWQRYSTFADIGTAQGALPVRVALCHPQLRGIGFDLPAVAPIFADYIGSFGLADRLSFAAGDVHTDPMPRAEVLTFGHMLHGYTENKRLELISAAYAAVPPGGALIVYDAMIDPGRRRESMTCLSSLNIMLEARDGFEASTPQCADWLRSVGFTGVRTRHLVGPTSMVYGFKPVAA